MSNEKDVSLGDVGNMDVFKIGFLNELTLNLLFWLGSMICKAIRFFNWSQSRYKQKIHKNSTQESPVVPASISDSILFWINKKNILKNIFLLLRFSCVSLNIWHELFSWTKSNLVKNLINMTSAWRVQDWLQLWRGFNP